MPSDATTATATPLRITIVGAGLGGLAAAVALRQIGHIVQVFERTANKTEVGAALLLQPSAMRVLKHLGVQEENLKGVYLRGASGQPLGSTTTLTPFCAQMISFDVLTGEETEIRFMPDGERVENQASFRCLRSMLSGMTIPQLVLACHRTDIYEELKRIALHPDLGLPPVAMRFGCKVSSCSPEAGDVVLESGETVHADLVLGADGIQSLIRTHVLGYVQEAPPIGITCCRAVFKAPPTDVRFSGLEWFTEGTVGIRSIPWKGLPFRMILCYPCRNGELINSVHFFTETEEEKKDVSHPISTPTITAAEVRAKFADYDPKYHRLLDLPDHTGQIYRWRLRTVPALPTWCKGRTGILGDAAHATLPFLAQGAAMAIEDAGVLAGLLPLGTTREDIPARLAVWEGIRKPRAEYVNNMSIQQVDAIMAGKENEAHVREDTRTKLADYNAIAVGRQAYQDTFAGGRKV
ncbi:unnamed protein product [Mycena citricolor]|uniref:FAD-binding domain-containing protein n=1 Tax=Mycena citricolor TaxID=2018698 RepID=A0AAD2H7I7_9AGAR|nr:unnamed protein product [Mycena citricolor]